MADVKKIPILFYTGLPNAVDASVTNPDSVEVNGVRRNTTMRYSRSTGVKLCSQVEFDHIMRTVYDGYDFSHPLRFKGDYLVLPLLDVQVNTKTVGRLDIDGKPVRMAFQNNLGAGAKWSKEDEVAISTLSTSKTPNPLFEQAPLEATAIPLGAMIDLGGGVVAIRHDVAQFRWTIRKTNAQNNLQLTNRGVLKAPKAFVEAWYRANYGVDYDYAAKDGDMSPAPRPIAVTPIAPIAPPAKQVEQVEQVSTKPSQHKTTTLSKFRVGLMLDTVVIKNCTSEDVFVSGALCQGTEDTIKPEITDSTPDRFGLVCRKITWILPEEQPNVLLVVDRDCRLANPDRADLVSVEGGRLLRNMPQPEKTKRKPRGNKNETTADETQ